MNTRYLEKKNFMKQHDELIKFAETDHIYTAFNPFVHEFIKSRVVWNGVAPLISTTEFIGTFFPKVDFGALAIRTWNSVSRRIEMEMDVESKYKGCTSVKDIEAVWSQGRILGTKMHEQFEDLSNLFQYEKDNFDKPIERLIGNTAIFPERRHFFEYLDYFEMQYGKHEFFRSELLFYDPIIHLSGCADTILYKPEDDTYVITDFKRMKTKLKRDPLRSKKSVKELGPGSKGKLLPAFKNVRNNACNKYGIQLTLYKHLFERMNPGKKISGLYLVVVSADKIGTDDALEIINIPLTKFDSCIRQAFRYRAEHLLATSHMYLPKAWGDAIGKELYVDPNEVYSTSDYELSDDEM